jgi:hypothetical protein
MGLRDCQRSFGASGGTQENEGFGVFRPQSPENLFPQCTHTARMPGNSWIVKPVLNVFHGSSIRPAPVAWPLLCEPRLNASEAFLGGSCFPVFLFEVLNQPRRPRERGNVAKVCSNNCANIVARASSPWDSSWARCPCQSGVGLPEDLATRG